MLNNDFVYAGDPPCNTVSRAPTLPATPKPLCGAISWDAKAKSPAIAATKRLFDEARKSKVAVFFVTGRHEFERGWTTQNLKNAGFSGFSGLYMEPNDKTFNSAADFKIEQRKTIQSLGYHIILSIGDQLSDLSGQVADTTVLYPNPFYRLP
jgi:predicted secreted acid phosphatase